MSMFRELNNVAFNRICPRTIASLSNDDIKEQIFRIAPLLEVNDGLVICSERIESEQPVFDYLGHIILTNEQLNTAHTYDDYIREYRGDINDLQQIEHIKIDECLLDVRLKEKTYIRQIFRTLYFSMMEDNQSKLLWYEGVDGIISLNILSLKVEENPFTRIDTIVDNFLRY